MKEDLIIKEDWSKKKIINSQSFDDLFNIKGISLWWFFNRFFVPWVMPKQINTFNALQHNKKLSPYQKFRLKSGSLILKQFIKTNEQKKLHYFKRKKVFSKNKKVLFLSYTNHLSEDNKIFRIQKILDILKQKRKIKEFVVFADPLSRTTFRRLHHRENIYQYYDEQISKKSLEFARETHRKWNSLDTQSKEKMLQIKGNSLWPYFKYAFNFYMSAEFLYFLSLYHEIFKKIIEKEQVEIVVLTGTSSLFERCIMAAAKHQKKKTIVLDHVVNLYDSRGSINPRILFDTTIAVCSKESKTKLIGQRVPAKSIQVVGPAIYDKSYSFVGPKRTSKKSIVIATSPVIETHHLNKKDYFKRFKKILQKINTDKNIKITIKLHPREIHIKKYKSLVSKLHYNNVHVTKGISTSKFYSLIKESDYFIHFGSNSSIEAMIIGRPVITINILNNDSLVYWINQFNVAAKAEYEDDIQKIIKETLKNKQLRKRTRKFLRDKIGNSDGRASERVVKLIELSFL